MNKIPIFAVCFMLVGWFNVSASVYDTKIWNKTLEIAAESGDAEAMFYLGNCFMNGAGVAQNTKKALDWYKESHRKKCYEATLQLADIYLTGKNVEKDSITGIDYLICLVDKPELWKDAEHGLLAIAKNRASQYQGYASYALGCAYQSYDRYFEAEKWLKKAHDLKTDEASEQLAYLYYTVDYDAASRRINTNDKIKDNLDSYDDNAERLKFRNRSNKNIDNAERWFNVAIAENKGWNVLLYHLSNVYVYEKEYKKAAQTLEDFLSKDDYFNGPPDDNLRLADLYVAADYKLKDAFDIYNQCYIATINDTDDIMNSIDCIDWMRCGLGKCYYYGKGVEQSYKKAFEYFKPAADNGDAEAMRYLSKCYRFGRGVSQNTPLADQWHRKSLECEDGADPESLRLQNMLENY